ncbi:hypothetical protein G6F65_021498 [Rhizopus arrhizus]|nr:hypothetical protein G6F32_013471 [Rhizopus arrhizus]KAG1244984.1 hypothetical protein G6F65_021498 [Rhizopus arrhizus]
MRKCAHRGAGRRRRADRSSTQCPRRQPAPGAAPWPQPAGPGSGQHRTFPAWHRRCARRHIRRWCVPRARVRSGAAAGPAWRWSATVRPRWPRTRWCRWAGCAVAARPCLRRHAPRPARRRHGHPATART